MSYRLFFDFDFSSCVVELPARAPSAPARFIAADLAAHFARSVFLPTKQGTVALSLPSLRVSPHAEAHFIFVSCHAATLAVNQN